MSPLPGFSEFFKALWNKDPFPWQGMLAARVAAGRWPEVIDLPTASGKTACLDIAVYALAAQADRVFGERIAPRRIWFVVDRRIVVDEAFERASRLAMKLQDGRDPAICAVAERLLALRGLPRRERPLSVARLRGGVLRDDSWARVPSQATIITSTVDQLGSRLLFRGYGHSALAAPIYAGLAGNDSLVLLDEAHCAVPFLQTLRAIQRFRSPAWSEAENPTPFHVAILSATPPGEDDKRVLDVFPAVAEREAALNSDKLQLRLRASKKADLVAVRDEEALVEGLVAEANDFARNGRRRIAIIVNRVGRAATVAAQLHEAARSGDPAERAFDVHLLTGRIRPVERDALVHDRLNPVLHSSIASSPARPLVLVATQCLEVGADFSFDALVTECASLDALRQRFGRLDRLGTFVETPARILVAQSSLREPDPIYGEALSRTWDFLQSIAKVDALGARREIRTVDFGVSALEPLLPEGDELRALLAPAPDAPVLLPAHLDLLCQTAPCPHPEPDLGLFLHGKGRSLAEVRVLWRCDLDPEHFEQWPEIVSLCRPISGEMLSVPLYRFQQWLHDRQSADAAGDIEGTASSPDEGTTPRRAQGAVSRFLLWRGRDRSEVHTDPDRIPPDSVVVLPVPASVGDAESLGQTLRERGFGYHQLDLWELAWTQTGRPAVLRLHRAVLAPWLGEAACPPLRTLLDVVETGEWTAGELRDALAAVRDWVPEYEAISPLPDWLRAAFSAVADFRVDDCPEHPGVGLILRARPARVGDNELDLFADEDDQPSEAPEDVTLDAHTAEVERTAGLLAQACLGQSAAPVFTGAARWHDAGKLDPRFQTLLAGGLATAGLSLAKSPAKPQSHEHARAICEAAGLPENFRHEMLSLQLAERFAAGDLPPDELELLRHLIASHHGHARPFAPVCEDSAPPGLAGTLVGHALHISADKRTALPPPHLLDSGMADRFWSLTRRFGWWGLAYREAILRLADWQTSAHPTGGNASPEHNP